MAVAKSRPPVTGVAPGPINIARVVAQHAETSRLLGVDFVPLAPGARRSAGPANATPCEPALQQSPMTGGRDRVAAQSALDAIRARYEADAPHRAFVTAFTNIVFGEGDPCARIMFIGEAPGADEDRTGRPFVGRAGQLLEKMIVAMGLSRERVYITNVLKTRPPNNATPTGDEAAALHPYLFDQIAAVRPEAIVTLGLSATRLVLSTQDSMGNLRGRWHTLIVGGLEVPVMPTFHPAFLLRQYTADNRAKVWSDLKQVLTKLGLPGATGSKTGTA